jgi:hypothetical protein
MPKDTINEIDSIILCLTTLDLGNAAGAASGKLTGRVVDDVEESAISGASIQVADLNGHIIATNCHED